METIQFGKLFYHDEYIDDATLLTSAISELAEHLGHSLENPLSLNLLCIELMISRENRDAIILDIHKALYSGKNGEIDEEINQANVFKIVGKIMNKHLPGRSFNELTIRSFTKALAKYMTTDLQQFISE